MAKKKLPPVLKAWAACRVAVGARPFKKMSARLKSLAKACVAKKLGRKSKRR